MSDLLDRAAARIAAQERAAILAGRYAELASITAQKADLLADLRAEPVARQRALALVLTAHQGLLAAARDGLRIAHRGRPQPLAFAAYGPDGNRAALAATAGRMAQRA